MDRRIRGHHRTTALTARRGTVSATSMSAGGLDNRMPLRGKDSFDTGRDGDILRVDTGSAGVPGLFEFTGT